MAFREKTAWLSFATLLVAYSIYFALIGSEAQRAQQQLITIIWTFGAVAVTQAIVVIIGSILLAATSTKDARAPADERDRAIARRGASISYYVLLVGVTIVGVVMPFGATSLKIINAALGAIVLAEVVRNAVILLSYRRGWHG